MSRNNYPEDNMKNAIKAVKNSGMSIRGAATKFKVPRMTLSDKCKGKTPLARKMGPPTILEEDEENNLVKWILHLGENGFPVSKDHLLDSVQMLVKNRKRETPFTDDRPGKHWYKAFLKRHPILTQRVSQNLTRTRAGVTEANIKNWFNEIKEYLEAKNIFDIVLNFGNRVFNCDETAFFLSPADNKVLARKGQKIVHNIINSDEKENLTTLLMGNAAGEVAPPMVVVNLKRIPKSMTESVPSSWAIGRSDNGWMTSQTFFEYFSMVFYPWLLEKKFEFPIIVFMDGHVSHLTLPLSEFCSDKNIELIALYPNSTHFLQPMDVAMFHPLKAAWKKAVYKWRIENSGTRLKRDNFCPLLKTILESTCKGSTLKNGFRACGLFPFNPDAIAYFKTKQVQAKSVSEERRKGIILNTELDIIEKNISKETLQQFKNSGDTWSGDIKDTNLFYFWRNVKEPKSQEVDAEIENISQNERFTEVDNLFLDGFLRNEDVLEFEIGDDGILEQVENDPDLRMEENANNEIGNEVTESNDAIHGCLNNLHEENPDKEDQNEVNEALEEYSEDAPGEKPNEDEEQNPNNETLEGYSKDASGEGLYEKKDQNVEKKISKEYSDDDKENKKPNRVFEQYLENSQKENREAIETDIEKIQVTPPQSPKPTSSKQQQNIPEGVATPFKNLLFWPEITPKIPKKLGERIPSVATCEKWKEYHRKKEEKKVQKQNEQEVRKRKRLEQQNKNKAKKTKEPKKTRNDSNDWHCVICEENTIENMICCMKCKQWMHNKCANVSDKQKKFYCGACAAQKEK